MNKKIVLSLAIALASGTAMAGGLNTNTNANAAFLRYFAQDANITLTSLYANPAGSAFLSKGWHFGICDQIAIQQRNVTTGVYTDKFGTPVSLLKFDPQYNSDTHTYKGKAFAPLIPSVDVSYNSGKKWSINAHLGVVGGGGACEYLDGMGTFDALYGGQMLQGVNPTSIITNRAVALGTEYGTNWAKENGTAYATGLVPGYIQQGMSYADAITAAQAATRAEATRLGTEYAKGTGAQLATKEFLSNYKATSDAYMKGSSYMYGLQVGATYKILDNLAVYVGIRGVYAMASYSGYVQDAEYSLDGGKTYTPYERSDGRDNVLSMNCDQTGFGVTPILGIHWTINKHWNVAAKYEFKTRIRMHNTTRMNQNTTALATQEYVMGQKNTALSTMGQFADGASIADDIPGYLAVGTQYSPIQNVRIGLAYHWMQDTKATKYGNKQNLIDKDTHEVLASAEWRCWKYLTVSGGWQRTMYGQSDAYMNDVSFNCSSNSLGLGVRIHPSKLFNIDLGYMHTFYQSRTVNNNNWMDSGLARTDTYNRKNDVIGVGLNFAW